MQFTLPRKKFFGIVVAPTAVVALYYALIATPVYQSTAVIQVTNPAKDTGGVSAFLSGGTGDSMTGAFLVKAFTDSDTEYRNLDKRFNLSALWGKGDIVSSYFKLFNNDASLYHFYQRHVDADIDKRSGITKLTTYAYTSKEANAVTTQLLKDSEDRINEINQQKDVDLASAAQRQLEQAKVQVAQDNAAIQAFRKRTGYYKPDLDYTAALQTQTSLDSQVAKAKADYSGVSGSTPNNPAMGGLQDQIASYSRDTKTLSKARTAINAVAKQYDALESKRNLDVTMMEKAGAVVQESILKAAGDHYYLQTISNPSEPITAEYPKALLNTLGLFLVLLVLYRFLFV